MLANRSQLSKKKLITYLAVIALMAGLNIYIYFNNSKNDSVANIYNNSEVNSLINTTIQTGANANPAQKEAAILEDSLFAKLKKIGDWPIVPSNVGKADPFAPYFAQ
ncbi:hypothetical protein GYA54_02745 [Candidatus Kuenenbacteria bacterium]|nr:hypothetical protein [Candidatus Kuenenbacteria bacterium]